MNETCAETPLLDLLRGVPLDARMTYKVNPTHHHMIPVGAHCAAAADEIERLQAEVRTLRNALWKACADDEEAVIDCIDSQREAKSAS